MKKLFRSLLSLTLCAVLCFGCCLHGFAYEPPKHTPPLTTDIRFNVFAIASSQVGYHEDSKHRTYYGEWWTDVIKENTGIEYDCTSFDWCCLFVCWCMYKAGALYGVSYNALSASVDYLFDMCEINGSEIYDMTEVSYTPQCGDLAFYSYDDGLSLGHVAITDGNNHFIHANYADEVKYRDGSTVTRTLDKNDYEPRYYVHPNYNETILNPNSEILGLLRTVVATAKFAPQQAVKYIVESVKEDDLYERPVIVKTVIPGDVNRDGEVTAADARLALRAAVQLDELTEEQMKRADLFGDGIVTADEARLILRAAVGLEDLSFYG